MQGKIALEEHFAPPADYDKRLVYVGSRLPNWPEFVRRQESMFGIGLKEMDDNGVEHTIVSLGAPAVQSILDPADALDLARRTNDYLAERCVQHPGRFSGFAAIPMQDPEAAATELERCVRDLGFKGSMVNGFTQLGLVEMTRKRTRESLAHVLCEPCPVCEGRGELKTAQTVCYQILRELLREARQFDAREFRILASQFVIDMFLDEESQSLAMLSDFIGKPVSSVNFSVSV